MGNARTERQKRRKERRRTQEFEDYKLLKRWCGDDADLSDVKYPKQPKSKMG